MLILKRILIVFSVLISIIIILFIIYYGPVDDRLSGKFKSDKEQTIDYLFYTKNIPEHKIEILKQLYGRLTIDIEGHKIKWIMPPHKIQNYPNMGEVFFDEGYEKEFYFISKTRQKEGVIYVLPKPIWNVKNIEIIIIEFDQDGFWINIKNFGGIRDIKEKFRKIE